MPEEIGRLVKKKKVDAMTRFRISVLRRWAVQQEHRCKPKRGFLKRWHLKVRGSRNKRCSCDSRRGQGLSKFKPDARQ
jgi:hypothetical protein